MPRYRQTLLIAVAAFAAGVVALRLIETFTARPPAAERIEGAATITDADTVEIQGTRVRLLGIDAPEMDQACLDGAGATWRCGEAARAALADSTAGRTWRCELRREPDKYGRRLGTCYVRGDSGDLDLDRWLVGQGWALSYRHYKPHPYDADEAAAREARRGLWAGAFIAPRDWRHRKCDVAILGAAAVPVKARKALCRS